MSFAVFQQTTPSSVIDACLFASFTDRSATNLILSKGNCLEVWDVQKKAGQGRLSLAYSVPLFGRPAALGAFKPREGGPQHLAVVFQRSRYLAVLAHSPEFGNARTCGQHVLLSASDPASAPAPSGFQPHVSVDPCDRCVAVLCSPDHVVVFPVLSAAEWQRQEAGPTASRPGGPTCHEDTDHPPGLQAPFHFTAWSPLRLHHITAVEFLAGYHQPTAVCLGQAKPGCRGSLAESNQGNSSLLVFVMDLADKSPHLIWAVHNLPHDVFQIVPLKLPVGGLLALAGNAVIYMKVQGVSFCQMLNPCSRLSEELSKLRGMALKDESKLEIALGGCKVAVLSATTLLFSVQPAGRLYLAHLVLEARDVVADIVWTSPGTSSFASGVCSFGEEYVFLAASGGGCTLLKVQSSKKKLPQNLQRNQPHKRQRTGKPGQESGDKNDYEKDTRKDEQTEKDEANQDKIASKSEQLAALMQVHQSLSDADRYIRSYNLAVSDEVPAFGAIQGLVAWCRESGEEGEEEDTQCGTERFAFCSGAGQRGALYVCQRAIPLESLTEFDLPAGSRFSAVWSLRRAPEDPLITEATCAHASDALAAATAADRVVRAGAGLVGQHRFVLVSGGSKSMVLQTTEEVEEISAATRLDMNVMTVCAGNVARGRLVAQVTARRVCFMLAQDPKAAGVPSPLSFARTADVTTGREACGGSICDPYVVVRFTDLTLKLFAVCSEEHIVELTDRLPTKAAGPVVCASVFRDRRLSLTLLTVLTPANRGTLRIITLHDMAEVFRAEHLQDVPPILRAHSDGNFEHVLDHLRALADVCAPLPKGSPDWQAAALKDSGPAESTALSAELVEVDADDRGPCLVVVLIGRPMLVYRAFMPKPDSVEAEGVTFPYHFSLCEHNFLGLVQSAPTGPYRPVVPLTQASGAPAGAVVVPPHAGIPALWLAARRNQLFVHPLPGTQCCGFSQLRAPCCENGFFVLQRPPQEHGAVAAHVCAPSTLEGLPADQAGFDLRGPLPLAKKPLQQTPHVLATRSDDQVVGLAVAELVLEPPEPAGPNADEDPLGEDWSIIRVPPVEADPPPMPRMHPRFELWLDSMKNVAKLGQFRFSFDSDEQVLCMEWVDMPGFPSPCLVVGTGVNSGEDLTCRGRVLMFSTKDREPGILPAVYQRSLKWPVTVVGQWGNYFVHSEGFKLFFERWENSNFNKLAFFDGGMCMMSMSSIKNFLLFGDLRKGIDFVQWKEDSASQNKSLRRLSRSPPSTPMTVLACEFIVCGKSLGLVALDHTGAAHLYSYSPHSDGREGDQLLRSCATFAMGFPCRAALRVQAEASIQCLFMASAGGELLCLKPIDDQVYRTVATLLGILSTRLPFRGGLNPRAFRHQDQGPSPLVAPRKNIEDAVLLRLYAFLCAPLQAAIAEKMRLPVQSLTKTTLQCATCQLFLLKPQPVGGAAK